MEVNSIALIGYRGSGKTAVAQALAARLGWDWVDADVEVELRAGKSIAAIFADDGETRFRDLEAIVVDLLALRQRTVLALGGGAILREVNRKAIRRCGAVVWLQASVATLERRIAADPSTAARRPSLTASGGPAEIPRLLAERTPHYRACATLEVDTEGKTPSDIADEIVAALGLPSGR
ncbi:MAG: shikimate kinase [Planctomycetaceae bacterium]|nr:shikimate kinase [Planctomycetaceae bacterium]